MSEDNLKPKTFFDNLESNLFSDSKEEQKKRDTLGFLNAQEIINKFLSVDRIEIKNAEEIILPKYTKNELAMKLGITVEELDKARQNKFYEQVSSKIILPLVTLYCSTKWVKDNGSND